MDHIPNATHLTPITTSGINTHDSECSKALGALSPSSPPYSSTTSNGRFSIPDFSGGSFTSDDFKRPPQKAANIELQNIGPDQISMIKVLPKQEYSNGSSGLEGRAVSPKEIPNELELLDKPEDTPEIDVSKRPGTEIHVNGEVYVLHGDSVFRPGVLDIPIKEHFRGYAVRANGVFKPLGGSPAAIDAGTLYRVTPTNKYSYTRQSHRPKALYRVKSVQQLLIRGTSGHEEYMYIYDPHWEGFVRTEEKRRFPPEKAMLKPGNPRGPIHTQGSQEFLASAEDSLQKADRDDFIKNKRHPPHKTLSSPALPQNKLLSSRVTGLMLPQAPRAPMFTNPINEQSSRVDENLHGSWLNIDLPLPLKDSPIAPNTNYPNTELKWKPDVHPLSPVPEVVFTSDPSISPPNDVVSAQTPFNSSAQCIPFSPVTTAFHKPIHRILGAGAPQTSGTYDPTTLQRLVNECVLVLCLYDSQSSRCPKIARITLPDSVSADFDDMDMFLKMREGYNNLRGFWRRRLSLRGLKRIDIIECHQAQGYIYPMSFRADAFSPEKLLECYLNPYEIAGDRCWVEWAHRLSTDEDRYALEFVEGWKSDKIVVAGVVPIALSIASGLLWGVYGPGQEYLVALALGTFVVILGWSIIGLLAVLSYSV